MDGFYASRSIFCLFVVIVLPFPTKEAAVTILDGDVYVEGVFSLYSTVNNTCVEDEVESEFVQNMEAIRWTYDQLNKDASRGSSANMYGTKIGFRVHTTCRSENSAETVGMELALSLRNSSNHLDSVGVIGPDFSSEAEALSRLLSSLPEKYRLLQLGFDTTSASLKDKTKFRNFYRTIPPDNIQVKVMNLLVQELDWTYMAIIYDNDSYGINGVSELLSSIKTNDVCFPYKIPVNPSVSHETLIESLESEISEIIINSSISGVLVFGSLTLGTAVLNATEKFLDRNPNFSSPVFLFSESSSYFDGQFQRVSKGAFAMSPPRREVNEFTDYWTSIFTDVTKLYETAASNMYIKLVYESTFACKLANSSKNHKCGDLTRDMVMEKLNPSLYNQYAIQAAMIIAKAVKDVHKNECGIGVLKCDKLLTVPRQKFVDIVNNLVITFDDEFSLRLHAFKNSNLRISFNGTSDASVSSGIEYEVYNHQKCPTNTRSNGFCFAQVATLLQERLTVNTSAIKDYNENGKELAWPNIRKSQCPDYKVCQECLTEYKDELYFVPGDMYIIGIMPVHNIGPTPLNCGSIKPGGIDIVETVRFAIEDAKSSFQNLVPNANIGFIIIDSCNDPQIIQEKILTLHRLGVYKDGLYIPVRDKILGYIGGWSSDVSVAVAEITSRLRFVQVSYGSTTPGLSNRAMYPFFLRTPAPDSVQADTMLNIVKHLGFNLVQILYSKSKYGEGGRDLIINAIKQDKNSACVAQSIGVSHLTTPDEIIDSINQQIAAKVILMFVSSFDLEWLLPVLDKAFGNNGYLCIASEEWGTRTDVSNFPNMKGTITLTSEIPVNRKFQDHLRSLKADGSDPDPWIRPYMEHTFGCYYEWSYNKSSGIQCSGTERLDTNKNYKIDAWAPFVEKAVISLLLGAHVTLQSTCGSTGSICETFTNKTALFAENIGDVLINDELGRPKRIYDDNGDGLAGYNIYTVTFTGASNYENIGTVATSDHSFQFNSDKWHSITGKTFTSTCGNQAVCKQCFPETSVAKSSSTTVAPVVIAVISVLGVVCCVLAGIQIWACYKYGCCIRIENGKIKMSNIYQTATPAVNQEMENYDVIREVGSGLRYKHDLYGDGHKRERLHRPDSLESTGTTVRRDSVSTDIKEGKDYIHPTISPPTEDKAGLDKEFPKDNKNYIHLSIMSPTSDNETPVDLSTHHTTTEDEEDGKQ